MSSRLLPPRPLPTPPTGGRRSSHAPVPDYDVDEVQRVIRADFTSVQSIEKVDKEFLLACADQDDMTLIIKGLANNLDPALWTWDVSRIV